MRLKEKVAIVTGAGGGIGRAIALRLAEEGAKVMVTDVNEESGLETLHIIQQKGGNASFFCANVTKEEEVKDLIQHTVKQFNQINILVNNAGIAHKETLLTEISTDVWNTVMDVDLNGVYLGMKHAIPEMIKAGGGSIVNTASVAGIKGQKFLGAYNAAKSAVITITKSTALEFGKHNIRVNAIAPSIIDTSLADGWKNSHKWEILEKANALRRIGKPEEVANVVLFLASEESSFMTGTTLVVDGGTLLGR